MCVHVSVTFEIDVNGGMESVCIREREDVKEARKRVCVQEKWSVCVIDANGMYKKASEINWKLSGWVLRGEFLTRTFQAAFYSVLFKAFKKKIHEWGTKGEKNFF